jgi:hypothetical protein
VVFNVCSVEFVFIWVTFSHPGSPVTVVRKPARHAASAGMSAQANGAAIVAQMSLAFLKRFC